MGTLEHTYISQQTIKEEPHRNHVSTPFDPIVSGLISFMLFYSSENKTKNSAACLPHVCVCKTLNMMMLKIGISNVIMLIYVIEYVNYV